MSRTPPYWVPTEAQRDPNRVLELLDKYNDKHMFSQTTEALREAIKQRDEARAKLAIAAEALKKIRGET